MCDCRQVLNGKMVEHFKDSITGPVTDSSFDNIGYGIDDTNTMFEVLNIPFTIQYKHTAKNGNVSTKKINTYVRASFCPFCGEKQ